MRVLIVAGGGGHFSPALAVIEQKPKDWDILLVGRKYAFEGDSALSLEYQTAKRLGLPFKSIATARLQRKITKHTLPSLIKMPAGLVQAFRIVSTYRPDVVLSFGGYVSVPVVAAASFLRIPVVIHEQTLHAGLANKIAVRAATKICISWKESEEYFPKEKTVLTGNPLRKTFIQGTKDKVQGTREDNNGLPVLYITGGSGGAHGINVLIEGCLEALLEKFALIHQTGDAKQFKDYDRLEHVKINLPEELQKRYEVKKFIEPERVMEVLRQADVIIARSGINTVTELLYLGKPSILIPLPYGQQNEQITNAKFVQKIGLAEIVEQLETTPDMLLKKINQFVADLHVYRGHSEAARELIHIDAAEKIITIVQSAYEKEKRISA